MVLRPSRGKEQLILVMPGTKYRTNSGPAALEGIVRGDYACVVGRDKNGTLVAAIVIFDIRPFHCQPPKPPGPHVPPPAQHRADRYDGE